MPVNPAMPTLRSRVRALLALGSLAVAPGLPVPVAARAATGGRRVVAAGETWEVTGITRLDELVVEEGASLTAPDGFILSLTVDGVETGSALVSTYGVTTVVVPGTYTGDVVLTPAAEHLESFAAYTFHLRQAVYAASTGVVTAGSVLSAVTGGTLTDTRARGVRITSRAQAFNGFHVTDGAAYTLEDVTIDFDGNGRCDFAGYGAAVTGDGDGTRLVVDGADIATTGVVRSALVARDGAHVVVKNSTLAARDGVLPDDFVPAGGADMLTVPWRLGLTGNVRATNVIGANTRATYLNSTVSSERWGVLSTDSVTGSRLTTVNSTVVVTGDSGYGTYADGKSMRDVFLGTDFDVATWVAISTGSPVVFGDSTAQAVAELNTELELGLSEDELARLEPRSCTLRSRGFGVMWHSGDGGSVTIGGGTSFTTAETMFLAKAVQAAIVVDGSQGAELSAGNGVLVQLMETDNPGSINGVYTEPTGDPDRDTDFDTTAPHTADLTAAFTDITLRGDFCNAMRAGKNLVVTFAGGCDVAGVISATTSRHAVPTITSAEWAQLSHVTNTPSPAVNNGVIVTVGAGSTWTVTGTSYLTRLVVEEGAVVQGPDGAAPTLTVDGVVTDLTPGAAYSGALALTLPVG
ncbi:hypothetical protein ACIPSE_00720 [Streptomyces sp. NPDC090106]|uniref:hypothetical protein n=1 Tax=Streptomyces sp. NPDC090106 TaxID=3365946 RepID=UPI003824535F